MVRSQAPLPEGITRSISHGRFAEAADALRGGLDVWDVAAPADWTFDDYNRGEKDIRAYLREKGARQTSIAYAENRGLVLRGSIFHQTAALRFAEGFENRRRNVTMLFPRTRSRQRRLPVSMYCGQRPRESPPRG
jgi:hypothetical protein